MRAGYKERIVDHGCIVIFFILFLYIAFVGGAKPGRKRGFSPGPNASRPGPKTAAEKALERKSQIANERASNERRDRWQAWSRCEETGGEGGSASSTTEPLLVKPAQEDPSNNHDDPDSTTDVAPVQGSSLGTTTGPGTEPSDESDALGVEV